MDASTTSFIVVIFGTLKLKLVKYPTELELIITSVNLKLISCFSGEFAQWAVSVWLHQLHQSTKMNRLVVKVHTYRLLGTPKAVNWAALLLNAKRCSIYVRVCIFQFYFRCVLTSLPSNWLRIYPFRDWKIRWRFCVLFYLIRSPNCEFFSSLTEA